MQPQPQHTLPDLNPNDSSIQLQMVGVLQRTSSIERAAREAAEADLKRCQSSVEAQVGYLQLWLTLACSEGLEPAIRQSAALALKNTIKASWNAAQAEHAVQEREKATIRQQIFTAMLSAPPFTEKILSEAVQIISLADFPARWPQLLDQIVGAVSGNASLSAMHGALTIATMVFHRYAALEELTEEAKVELLEINSKFTTPLIHCMRVLLQHLTAGTLDVKTTEQAVRALTAGVTCYSSLTTLDMGQEHEDNLQAIMDCLRRALEFSHPQLLGDADEPGPILVLHSAVIDCILVHLQQYDSEFAPFVGPFVTAIWKMLQLPENRRRAADNVVISSMEFLNGISRSGHYNLFAAPGVLQSICEHVLIPSLHLREDVEVELFNEEPEQYVQQEIEGSDVHTRRRSALELIRAMNLRFEAQLTPMLQNICLQLLQQPQWISRDAAIYLITALAIRGATTNQRGAADLNPKVPLDQFFETTVLPELTNATVAANSHAIVKADCIKFVATFRSYLPVAFLGNILVQLAEWVNHDSVVVHSYAAHAIERILMMRPSNKAPLVVSSEVFAPAAPRVIFNVCTRLVRTAKPNEYLMRCLMSLLKIHPQHLMPVIGDVTLALTSILGVQLQNPSNPVFNHCLWECISYVIKHGKDFIPQIESLLWTPLINVMVKDVTAFLPYAFQVLAQLVEARAKAKLGNFESYLQLYPELVKPVMFEMRGNIPAIVKLLSAFNRSCPEELDRLGMTLRTLGVFQNLLALKQFDHEGFNLLGALVLHASPSTIDPHMGVVLQLIFERQQKSPTAKFIRCEVFLFGVITAKRGAQYFAALADSIQPNLSKLVLNKIWLPNVGKVHGELERKISAIALTRIAVEVPAVVQDMHLLVGILGAIIRLLYFEVEADDRVSFMPTTLRMEDLAATDEEVGFTNQYCPLHGAQTDPADPTQSISDPKAYFSEHLRKAFQGPAAAAFQAAVSVLQPELRNRIS